MSVIMSSPSLSHVALDVLGPPGADPVILTNYINGIFVRPIGGEYIPDLDPATGQEAARVPRSSLRDVDSAAVAAKVAFMSWSKTSITERAAFLDRIADLVRNGSSLKYTGILLTFLSSFLADRLAQRGAGSDGVTRRWQDN